MKASVVVKFDVDDENILIKKPKDEFMNKVQKVLDDCKEKKNGFVTVEFSTPRKKRTLNENNLFWALCTLIANEVGDDSEGFADTENGIKERALSRGYPYHINRFNGDKVPNSMTTVDTVEMSYLIDTAIQICSELGIVIPTNLKESMKI